MEKLIKDIKKLAVDFWTMNLHNGKFENHLQKLITEYDRNLLIEYEIFKRGESLDSDVPNNTKIDVFLNSRN